LSVVQAVVDDHSGFLQVASEVGQGSTFCVYLPITRTPIEAALPSPLAGGTERILVVDDDPFQRAVAREMLESLGYRVQLAESGEEAVSAATADDFDLLLLDIVMPPGIDGAETFRRIRERCPNQQAILLSGFAETERVAVAQSLGAGAFVRKPVTLQRLASSVRAELDRPLPETGGTLSNVGG